MLVDQTATSTHVSGCYIFFIMFTLKNYFMSKHSFFLKFKALQYVLKTYFDSLNISVNNLDDMESEVESRRGLVIRVLFYLTKSQGSSPRPYIKTKYEKYFYGDFLSADVWQNL